MLYVSYVSIKLERIKESNCANLTEQIEFLCSAGQNPDLLTRLAVGDGEEECLSTALGQQAQGGPQEPS